MIFTETPLSGAFVIDIEKREDDRGFFARAWSRDELERRGLVTKTAQANIAHNFHKGTLRGMHYQVGGHAEVKIVRCTRGALRDVILDLRQGSPTFGKWFAVDLTADNRRTLYVPVGFAHGYQTLVDDTEAFYLVSESYAPEAERGVRWNDPAFAIEWPEEPRRISIKDRSWPDFDPQFRSLNEVIRVGES